MNNTNQVRVTLKLAGMKEEICIGKHQWQQGTHPPDAVQQLLANAENAFSSEPKRQAACSDLQRTVAYPKSALALHLENTLDGAVAVTVRQVKALASEFHVPSGGRCSVIPSALRCLGFVPASRVYKIAKKFESVYFRPSEVSEQEAVQALRYPAI
jgi:hypothetical protein